MTQLELVKNENGLPTQRKTRTVLAVSTSYSALVEYCNETYGEPISEVDCGKQKYYTIENTPIAIVPAKF